MPTQRSKAFLRGDITIKVTDRRTGRVVNTVQVRNKIVQSGLNALPLLLAQDETEFPASQCKLGSLRVGTSTVAPTIGDVGLHTPVAAGNVTLDAVNLTTNGGVLTVQATLPEALNSSPVTLTEAGLFLVNGTLFARQIHSSITTGPGLRMDYTWVLTFTA